MSHTLYVRNNDAAALKVCVAAAASGTAVKVVQVATVADLPSQAQLPAPRLGLPVLITVDGAVVQDMNAAAKLAGGSHVVPAGSEAALDGWLEYDTQTVFPALSSPESSDSGMGSMLRHLNTVLAKAPYLLGDFASLADISIGCDLLWSIWSPLDSIKAYLDRLLASVPFQAGLQQLGIGADLAALHESFTRHLATAAAAQPKLPKPGARNVLITSALPYVNNVPHLGNIIGCVLSADVYARYCRARGYNSVYVCGTDEYGTATETKALEEGMTCQQICDKYHAIHKQIYDWFDIEFDSFGRTPTRAQTEICQEIFTAIHDGGRTVTRTNEQLYSLALDKFLADRFVVGTCPKCGYDDARGDQCDACGALLNPTELRGARCKFSGTTPVLRETSHIYIDLPQLADQLAAYVQSASSQGGWSNNCKALTDAWLRGGLKERCITRDLKWGTPVPADGFRGKVFYVWFDAPIGYLSITANYTPEWRRWWQSPDDVELVQFMGKDNVTFHTIIFPCTLLGTGQRWTMMKKISVTEYLNYEGGKFSKSRGTGVFGNDAATTGLPVEVFRYYLLASRPETTDTDFRWADLAQRNNNELLKNLGNFVNRAVTFCFSKMGAEVPAASAAGMDLVACLNAEVGDLCDQYVALLEAIKIRDGIAKALQVSAAGNKFLQEAQPWKAAPDAKGTYVAAALGVVKVLAALLQPYMPSVARKILCMLNGPWAWTGLGDAFRADARALHTALPASHKLGAPVLLFEEIKDDVVEALQRRFSGTQAEAAADAAPMAGQAVSSGKQPHSDAAARKPGSAKAPAAKQTSAKPAAGDATTRTPKAGGKDRPADISRLDLRVGRITAVARHPDADSLYVEEVACGEDAPRTVVSGLVRHVAEADMQGRLVVLVTNLKPANMRGVKSHAMVLAATGADGQVELVDPPASSQPGDPVFVDGFEGAPDQPLQLKVFDKVHPDLKTSDKLVASYRGLPLRTSTGPCTVQSIQDGSIR